MMTNSNRTVSSGLHKWRFFRSGGFDQVRLETGADLKALDQLDPKLWAALGCPTSGLEFDERTLQLIDTDEDGHIRAPEVVAAVKWATSMLENPDDLLRGAAELPLAAIDDSTPEGAELLASARQILLNLGKEEATVITAEDTADTPGSSPTPGSTAMASSRPPPPTRLPRRRSRTSSPASGRRRTEAARRAYPRKRSTSSLPRPRRMRTGGTRRNATPPTSCRLGKEPKRPRPPSRR